MYKLIILKNLPRSYQWKGMLLSMCLLPRNKHSYYGPWKQRLPWLRFFHPSCRYRVSSRQWSNHVRIGGGCCCIKRQRRVLQIWEISNAMGWLTRIRLLLMCGPPFPQLVLHGQLAILCRIGFLLCGPQLQLPPIDLLGQLLQLIQAPHLCILGLLNLLNSLNDPLLGKVLSILCFLA